MIKVSLNKAADISKQGYKDNSPYKNAESLKINSPSGRLTMDSVNIPLQVTNEFGQTVYLPPNSGTHQLQGTQFVESPVFQDGGNIRYRAFLSPLANSFVFKKPNQPVIFRDEPKRPNLETQTLDPRQEIINPLQLEKTPEINVTPTKEPSWYQRTGFNSQPVRIQPSNYDKNNSTWRGEPFQKEYQEGGSLPKYQEGTENSDEGDMVDVNAAINNFDSKLHAAKVKLYDSYNKYKYEAYDKEEQEAMKEKWLAYPSSSEYEEIMEEKEEDMYVYDYYADWEGTKVWHPKIESDAIWKRGNYADWDDTKVWHPTIKPDAIWKRGNYHLSGKPIYNKPSFPKGVFETLDPRQEIINPLQLEKVPEINVTPTKEPAWYQRTGFNSQAVRIDPRTYDPNASYWRGEPFQKEYQDGGSLPKYQEGVGVDLTSQSLYDLKQYYIEKGYTSLQSDAIVKDYIIKQNNPLQGEVTQNNLNTVRQNAFLNSSNNFSQEQINQHYPQLVNKKQEGGEQIYSGGMLDEVTIKAYPNATPQQLEVLRSPYASDGAKAAVRHSLKSGVPFMESMDRAGEAIIKATIDSPMRALSILTDVGQFTPAAPFAYAVGLIPTTYQTGKELLNRNYKQASVEALGYIPAFYKNIKHLKKGIDLSKGLDTVMPMTKLNNFINAVNLANDSEGVVEDVQTGNYQEGGQYNSIVARAAKRKQTSTIPLNNVFQDGGYCAECEDNKYQEGVGVDLTSQSLYDLKQYYIEKGYTSLQSDAIVKDYIIKQNNPLQGEVIQTKPNSVSKNAFLNSPNNFSQEQINQYYPQLVNKKQENVNPYLTQSKTPNWDTFQKEYQEGGSSNGVNSEAFKTWYARYSSATGNSPNPYEKEHYYDYESFFNDNITNPSTLFPIKTNDWHLPSKYKLEGHPRTYEYEDGNFGAEYKDGAKDTRTNTFQEGGQYNSILDRAAKRKTIPLK